jgi:YesN/AraC family two-component response regulator
MEQEAVNTLYNMLSEQDKTSLIKAEQKYLNYQYLLLASVLFIILISLFIIFKSQSRKKRLREIINYIEITKNNYLKIKPSVKVKTKGIDIPEETEHNILSKLKRFEKSNKFLNKDMSLAVLAGQFETNTKYLSGVINKHYHDNFNTFINKLRINYIIDKLKNDPNYINYKISFLADESGYSSHSSFATVFKSVVGMSPVTFIKLIQKERKELVPKYKDI